MHIFNGSREKKASSKVYINRLVDIIVSINLNVHLSSLSTIELHQLNKISYSYILVHTNITMSF